MDDTAKVEHYEKGIHRLFESEFTTKLLTTVLACTSENATPKLQAEVKIEQLLHQGNLDLLRESLARLKVLTTMKNAL